MHSMLIGASVLAIGTSLPELAVGIISSYYETGEILYATIIGSNLFNLFCILGIPAFFITLSINKMTLAKDIPLAILSILLVGVLVNDHLIFGAETNELSASDTSIIFVFFLFHYILMPLKSRTEDHSKDIAISEENIPYALSHYKWGVSFDIISGLTMIVLGAFGGLLLSVKLSQFLGMSHTMLSLLILAPGTSLPEMVTIFIALKHNQKMLAIGNAIGSNLFNILFVLPASNSFGSPAYPTFLNVDLLFLLTTMVMIIFGYLSGKNEKMPRLVSFSYTIVFVMYMVFVVNRG
ncbi:cation:H+ antiporter [Sediminitomix flava]|uniref:Cation:H+ antiporter n=2 Tax=Sediminitomix flava TaxID=379075 RepID=A0A315ZG68_SEDFL|nr:cation:H+ antiporter [Sediminitomix flava]